MSVNVPTPPIQKSHQSLRLSKDLRLDDGMNEYRRIENYSFDRNPSTNIRLYGNTTTQPMYRCMATHADPAAACHKLKIPSIEVEHAVMSIIKKQAEVVLNSADLSGFQKSTVNNKILDGSVVHLNNIEIEKGHSQNFEYVLL